MPAGRRPPTKNEQARLAMGVIARAATSASTRSAKDNGHAGLKGKSDQRKRVVDPLENAALSEQVVASWSNQLPPESEREGETVLELKKLQTDGSVCWESRRLVYDKSNIWLAKADSDMVLDLVPLLECAHIIEVKLDEEVADACAEDNERDLKLRKLESFLSGDEAAEKNIVCAADTKEDRAEWVKALSAMCNSNPRPGAVHVIFRGALRKRGQLNTAFKKRFFALRSDGVCGYFGSEADFGACLTDSGLVREEEWRRRAKGSFLCAELGPISLQASKDGFLFTLCVAASSGDAASSTAGSTASPPTRQVPARSTSLLSRSFSTRAACNQVNTAGLNVVCSPEGRNGGRIYTFRLANEYENARWAALLIDAQKAAHNAALGTTLARAREAAQRFCQHAVTQVFFGLVIVTAFAVSLVDAELMPSATSPLARTISVVETIVASVFIFELALNLFAWWFWPFLGTLFFLSVSFALLCVHAACTQKHEYMHACMHSYMHNVDASACTLYLFHSLLRARSMVAHMLVCMHVFIWSCMYVCLHVQKIAGISST